MSDTHGVATVLDEREIQWKTEIEAVSPVATMRQVKVMGQYKDITFGGMSYIPAQCTTDQALHTTNELKAGITNLIINAVVEEQMEVRVAWGDYYETVDEDGGSIVRLSGNLDNDPDKSAEAAVRNPGLSSTEDVDALKMKLKYIIWSEFMKKGWV